MIDSRRVQSSNETRLICSISYTINVNFFNRHFFEIISFPLLFSILTLLKLLNVNFFFFAIDRNYNVSRVRLKFLSRFQCASTSATKPARTR